MSARKVYRKEDILQMGSRAVNAGWGPRGAATYSIWLYKGGGNCHHFWLRQIYKTSLRGAKSNLLSLVKQYLTLKLYLKDLQQKETTS